MQKLSNKILNGIMKSKATLDTFRYSNSVRRALSLHMFGYCVDVDIKKKKGNVVYARNTKL